ncbi:MAG: FapA family protein [Sulfurimicrobium sp.]|nr:FapA family protein [Sulfurimicrobium sp.]
MDEAQDAQAQPLTLSITEDSRKLLASFTPAENLTPIDLESLKLIIAEAGYAQLFLSEPALAQLVKQYATASEPFSLEIGEVRDAVPAVEISADKMSAWLTVTPPCGGAAVTKEQIDRALSAKGVAAGIQDRAIDQVLADGTADRMLIAQGRQVVHGEDGRLECLIPMVKDRHPHLDEHDIADYRDLGGIVTVHQGERLMQKHPPTLGEAGENVLGQVIPAKPGKEAMYAPQLKGAMVDPEDPAFLVSEIPGQPVEVSHGMTVEPTVTLQAIDLSTGNLDFDGTVNVIGDVHAGMSIRATGDIHVGGTVEAATLDAGGDVVVKGGIIGHGEVHDHPDEKQKANIARIRCAGSCSAHFVENASIETGDSILVDDLVMQSELAAINQIMVGKPGSGKGSIIGGLTEATLLVQAAMIGSPAGVKTRVMVGSNPYLHDKLKRTTQFLEKKAKEMEDVIKLLTYVKTHPERMPAGILVKAENTQMALMLDMETLQEEKEQFELELVLAVDAKVVAEKTVFGGTQIEIGGQIHHVEIQRGGGSFVLGEDGITFQ